MRFDEHKKAAFEEDVDFLLEGGLSLEQIAKRLGVTRAALQKWRERERRKREKG